MDEIAEFLIEKETITGKEFMQIYRRCKGIPEPEEKKDRDGEAEKKDQAAGETLQKQEEASAGKDEALPEREWCALWEG